MKRKGVIYDVGVVMHGIDWRPDYSPEVVRREMQIIAEDLHANAVKIRGRDIDRVIFAGGVAAELGMEVWLCPELWERPPNVTIAYLEAAARAAEQLRRCWPDRVVLSVGTELTLFMRGIVSGRSLASRVRHLKRLSPAARNDTPLRSFVNQAALAARRHFDGPLTYAALPFERVDWDRFNIVGVNRYWYQTDAERYIQALQPWLGLDKPFVISEMGFRTRTGADETGPAGPENIAVLSGLLHGLPGIGALVRPRLRPRVKVINERNEALQAASLTRQFEALDQAGVDGAFVWTFTFPLAVHHRDPRHDLDVDSFSLVKTLPKGEHGTAYPDLGWEPKQSFAAVAEYYAGH